MSPGRLPDGVTAIGSLVISPDVLETLVGGGHHPGWTCALLGILVAPKLYVPTVNAMRDIVVAFIGRNDDPPADE